MLGSPRSQAIHTPQHFNGLFIKVQPNSAILPQTRSCNHEPRREERSPSIHQTLTPGSHPETGFFFFFFCGSENRLGLDRSTPAPKDKEATSKSTWWFQAEPRPARLGGRKRNGDGAVGEQGAQAGAADWHRGLFTRAPPTTRHQRCGVNSVDSSSHNMNPVSLLAEKRQG